MEGQVAAPAESAAPVQDGSGVELGHDEGTEVTPNTWESVTKRISEQDAKEFKPKEQVNKESRAREELAKLGEEDLEKFVEVKINGKLQTVKVKEALEHYGIKQAAHKKMTEADRRVKEYEAKLRQQDADFRAFAQDLKQNPEKYLKKMGYNPEELAEKWLAQKFEQANMSPEQRRAIELEQQLQFERQQREQLQKQNEEREMTQLETRAHQQLEKETAEAWDKVGLPADKRFGIWMTQLLYESSLRKEDLSPQEAAAIVKDKFVKHSADIFRKMDAAAIHEVLGDDVIDKLRQYQVEKVTGKKSAPMPQKGEPKSSAPPAPKGPMNEEQWRAYWGKL